MSANLWDLPQWQCQEIKTGLSQCCGSGIFIPDPDFYPSRIPDPKTATKERGEKCFFVKHFFVATNFTKLKIILIFN
jgi:hypothetical protein